MENCIFYISVVLFQEEILDLSLPKKIPECTADCSPDSLNPELSRTFSTSKSTVSLLSLTLRCLWRSEYGVLIEAVRLRVRFPLWKRS
ncbi:hypothetical protein DPMN_066752 [Dreissena polymorpha]|uniref:Uncharacterized protein n=1 Tax=Dreissena polymorpha TaxID=45954 RepID=A0A9D3YYI5_DREPO|nr:hypothetical protein DPMN_066752 [Dreissena polymorpha]